MTTATGRSWDEAERVARQSYGRLVAFLSARSRDVASAEDALSEAFAAALSDWPQKGVPHNPEAWLLTAARRRQMDAVRRGGTRAAAADHLKLLADELSEAEAPDIPDERLRLMFACAHPAIDRKMRGPLILQTILGFDAATIAAVFLVPAATMGQRLVRAKAKIRDAGIAFRLPDRVDMPERLDAVLEAIYAAFSEGWTDPSGTESRRRGLAEEAIWLGRLVVALLPDEPEALGLLALMLHLEARREARRTDAGGYVPLADQDPAKWDGKLIDEAEDILLAASHRGKIGRYQLEAAVQSAHAIRRQGFEPDWPMLEALYGHLLTLTGSPVVAINRAVVIASSRSVEAGLAALEAAGGDERLAAYQPYWAARADLLARAGRKEEADAAYGQAIGLETDPAIRSFLEERRQLTVTS
ncbi:RNA polymerase sigma factor [Rhizobium terrae]|uniref:RNA polymerase sigma factor n=1 Tax=Rhizobium terrae TaxID=2171756 RepID=UPI000E3E202F|nr:DUF6596 domain-containing protein [Rhizobium terrae]